MLIIDSLLIGGIRFVLDKIAAAVETELNDEGKLREELLAAQMRVELGEMSQEEFDGLEAEIIVRIREIKERQRGGQAAVNASGEMKVTGIEATFEGEEH
jgi:Gas vesicle protein G